MMQCRHGQHKPVLGVAVSPNLPNPFIHEKRIVKRIEMAAKRNEIGSGKIVWIPAKVGPGMFPNERYVKVETSGTTVSGFVPAQTVREEPSESFVRAVVMKTEGADEVTLIFSGEILTASNPISVSKKWLSKASREFSE